MTSPEASQATPTPEPVQSTNSTPVHANEPLIWQRLRAEGWSAVQVAGIMGNLRQESGYKTSDTPNGLGIAQWLGARRERLVNLGRYEELGTQLNYLVYELRMIESTANAALLKATDVTTATVVFQDLYERCNPFYCNEDKRIEYAKDVLNRYQ